MKWLGLKAYQFIILGAFLVGQNSLAYNKNEMISWGAQKMREHSPGSYKIFKNTRRGDFSRWFTGNDISPVDDLLTAVHESSHFQTAKKSAYTMVNGEEVPQPDFDRRLLPPSVIGNEMPNSIYRDIYLRSSSYDAATSNKELSMLLDEFNSYIHDADLSNKLHPFTPRKWKTINYWNGSEGVFAFMTYLQKYLTRSKGNPGAWSALKERKHALPIRRLWEQAEQVIEENCKLAGGFEQRRNLRVHMKILCESSDSALREILERPSRGCAQSCGVAVESYAPVQTQVPVYQPNTSDEDIYHFGTR